MQKEKQFKQLTNEQLNESASGIEAGMVLQLADGSIQAYNAIATRILGLTAEQLRHSNFRDLAWQNSDASIAIETPDVIALRTGKPCLNVVRDLRKPNGVIRLLMNSQPLFQGSDTPYAVVTTFSEITQQMHAECDFVVKCDKDILRQQAQEELHKKQRLIQQIADTTPGLLYLYDLIEKRNIYVNRQIGEILGYTPQQIQAMGAQLIPQLMHPEDLAKLPSYLERFKVAAEGEIIELEYRLRHANGEWRWIWSREIVFTRTADGTPCQILGTAQDITALKQIEAELRRANERFELAAAAVNCLIYDWDCKQNTIERSEGLTRIFGYTLAEAEPTPSWWNNLVHPDDLARMHASLANVKNQNRFAAEYRVRNKNNQYVYVLDQGIVVRDANGARVRVVGSTTDISDRYSAQAALRDSEERYRQLVELSPDGIIIQSDGKFVFANAAALKFFGATSSEQLIGKPVVDLIYPEVRQQVTECIQQLQEKQAVPLAEEKWLRLDGKVVDAEVTAIPFTYNNQPAALVVIHDITKRKQTEQSLAQHLAILNAINEATTTLIFVKDRFGRIVIANPATIRIIGKPNETVGKTDADFLSNSDDAQRIMENDRLVMETGQVQVFEEQVEFSEGTRTFLSTKSPYRDREGNIIGLIGVSTDITERKLAQEALQESELRFRQLAENVENVFWLGNIDNQVLYINPAYEKIWGRSRESLKADRMTWVNSLHPEDRSRILTAAQEKGLHGKYDEEYRIVRPDGTIRWVRDRAFPIANEQGEIVRIAGIAEDITALKIAEAERTLLLEREQAARQQAETANRVKDEFLAVLSHELRSPLNPILGWAKLLRTRKFDEAKTQQALEIIQRNAELQTKLIEDLLDVSRILRGKLSLNVSPVNLVTTIAAALETVTLAAQAKAIKLTTVFDANVGQILGDSNRLQQVIWNLLTNAVKFTPAGGCVEVRLECIGADAQIRVSDTGKGIDAEFLPYVFDYFRQADSTTTRKFGGLGLGLAIVRQLVELHGGTIKVESAGEGQGATFTLRLPLMKAQGEIDADTPAPVSTDILPLNGIQILVVDDEVDSREFVAVVLEQYGAKVIATASATEALAALVQLQADVLISDIGMPEIDGYMLMRQVRMSAQGSISAIALTAYAGESDRQLALDAGYNMHLAKPVEPSELVASVAQLVQE